MISDEASACGGCGCISGINALSTNPGLPLEDTPPSRASSIKYDARSSFTPGPSSARHTAAAPVYRSAGTRFFIKSSRSLSAFLPLTLSAFHLRYQSSVAASGGISAGSAAFLGGESSSSLLVSSLPLRSAPLPLAVSPWPPRLCVIAGIVFARRFLLFFFGDDFFHGTGRVFGINGMATAATALGVTFGRQRDVGQRLFLNLACLPSTEGPLSTPSLLPRASLLLLRVCCLLPAACCLLPAAECRHKKLPLLLSLSHSLSLSLSFTLQGLSA